MKKSILDKIQKREIKVEKERVTVYKLGLFNDKMFELVELYEGKEYKPHFHRNAEANLNIILGTGVIILDNKKLNYKPGDFFLVKKSMSHGFKVKTQTLILSIQSSPIIDPKTGEIDFEYTGQE